MRMSVVPIDRDRAAHAGGVVWAVAVGDSVVDTPDDGG
jgi:hypothetical protein